MTTTLAKLGQVERKWYVVDASGKTLGRLAVRIANVLRGRHKPIYTRNVDTGDFVVVLNAQAVKLSGKKDQQKYYDHYSGFRGGLKRTLAADMRARHPERMIQLAVKGMMPRNKLCGESLKRLKVYAGTDHPHAAQQPQPLIFES